MTSIANLPIVVSADRLLPLLPGSGNLLVVDLQSAEHYRAAHLPGAVNLDYNRLLVNRGAAGGGLLPDAATITALFQELGINNDSHVVAYDTEGGASASRLIWTLNVYGHKSASILDGGLLHWANSGNPLEREQHPNASAPCTPNLGNFVVKSANSAVIDGDELIARFNEPGVTVVDARSAEEYSGAKAFSARGGHIPGAKHFEWTDALDLTNNAQLKSVETLQSMLAERQIEKGQEVIVHCQTHRRSSLSYVVLKHLGYENVRGYHGSWSEWGNRSDTPIES